MRGKMDKGTVVQFVPSKGIQGGCCRWWRYRYRHHGRSRAGHMNLLALPGPPRRIDDGVVAEVVILVVAQEESVVCSHSPWPECADSSHRSRSRSRSCGGVLDPSPSGMLFACSRETSWPSVPSSRSIRSSDALCEDARCPLSVRRRSASAVWHVRLSRWHLSIEDWSVAPSHLTDVHSSSSISSS